MDDFNRTTNQYLSFLRDGQYTSAIAIILLILYGTAIAPKLPVYILSLFDHPIVKLLMFFLIAYIAARKDPSVAIVAALCVMVTIHTLNQVRFDQLVNSLVKIESMEEPPAQIPENGESVPSPPEVMQVEEEIVDDASLNGSQLNELDNDSLASLGAPIAGDIPPGQDPHACQIKLKYRDSFYPQYVNMDRGVYDAKNSGDSVPGFDHGGSYASV